MELAALEEELKKLSDAHYAELFGDKREHKTPFGSLKYTKSTSLETEDEEKTILQIELACAKGEAPFTASDVIRTRKSLNLEALEKQSDLILAQFGIRREKEDNFKVSPFTMKTDKPAKKNGKAQAAV